MLAIRPLRRNLHGLMFMAAQAGTLTLISGSRCRFVKQETVIIQLLCVSFAVLRLTSCVFTFCNKHTGAWTIGNISYCVCCATLIVVSQYFASLSTNGSLEAVARVKLLYTSCTCNVEPTVVI